MVVFCGSETASRIRATRNFCSSTDLFLFVNACRRHYDTKEKEQEKSQERYDAALSKAGGVERLASGSDDFTLFMWEPTNDKKPTTRMTGHVGVVNHLAFSPDGKHLASASFDKKVKVWDGKTGVFAATLTGHVGRVYQVRCVVSSVAGSWFV